MPMPSVSFDDEEEPQEVIEPYDAVKWKNILDTFYCNTCGMCLEDEDGMILHVIRHVPEAQREALMQELINKKENKHGKNSDHSTGS